MGTGGLGDWEEWLRFLRSIGIEMRALPSFLRILFIEKTELKICSLGMCIKTAEHMTPSNFLSTEVKPSGRKPFIILDVN